MVSRLLDHSLHQVREAWSDRLEIDVSTLQDPGLTLISREGSYGLVSLKFVNSIVAICQPSLLRSLSQLSPADLFNMPLLVETLREHKVNPIGVASISYVDETTLQKVPHSKPARHSNVHDIDSIMSSCNVDEQEESAIATMSTHYVVDSSDGTAAAVAGYEVWNDKIAQLGVLTKLEHRGQGLASSAAHAAAKAALSTGLIPQWRCQIGNVSSYRLSQKLGFHEVGLQLAIDVAPPLN